MIRRSRLQGELSMSTISICTARLLIAAVFFALCGTPEALRAQSTSSSPPEQNTTQSPPPGGMVDPSKGPLEPVKPSGSLPEAPSSAPQSGAQSPPPQQPRQPLGTAVGQQGVTTGGVASRPAGAAIAPAKQRQYRSLFIKIGAIAAAGAAIGTIVALTKGSPSTPPGAR
jgi:hypothetical protein